MAQIVEALCYKPEGRGYDSRLGHGDFLFTYNGPGIDSASSGVDSVSTRVDSASSGVDSVSTRVDSASSGVDSVSTRVDSASSGVDSTSTGVDLTSN